MLGLHKIPKSIEIENIKIKVVEENGFLVYNRSGGGPEKKTVLPENSKEVLISPVEPLNLPKRLAEHLLVIFKTKIMVAPKSSRKLYLIVPSEIGVFINSNDVYELIDYFSNSKMKFSLYGEIKGGILCRYWESEIYYNKPDNLDILSQTLIELEIINQYVKAVEVKKAVFDAYAMELFYTSEFVQMRAKMIIYNKNLAETVFLDSPAKEGMAKFMSVFIPPKLLPRDIKFKMEMGI